MSDYSAKNASDSSAIDDVVSSEHLCKDDISCGKYYEFMSNYGSPGRGVRAIIRPNTTYGIRGPLQRHVFAGKTISEFLSISYPYVGLVRPGIETMFPMIVPGSRFKSLDDAMSYYYIIVPTSRTMDSLIDEYSNETRFYIDEIITDDVGTPIF